jgi:hypothetical protein
MAARKGIRLRLVGESEARGRTQEIYEDIKHTLGVPQVSALFQALAAHPEFLDVFWRAVRPAVQTQQFFRLGDRLRADAYTRMHNYFQVPDLHSQDRSPESRQQVSEVVELFHYVDPLLLLFSVALMQALAKPLGQSAGETSPAEHPVFPHGPQLVTEEMAPAQIKLIYEDMKRTLDLPVLSTAYQAFASFPAFLESYWNALKPVAQSALYTESHAGVRETAWSLAREFPARMELTGDCLSDAGVSDDDIAMAVRIVDLFVGSLSRTVLNVAVAKIGLEGGSARAAAPPKTESAPKQAA